MKYTLTFIGALILALIVTCTMAFKKVQMVRVPVSVHLNENQYKILRTDTIADTVHVVVGDTLTRKPILTVRYFYLNKGVK